MHVQFTTLRPKRSIIDSKLLYMTKGSRIDDIIKEDSEEYLDSTGWLSNEEIWRNLIIEFTLW